MLFLLLLSELSFFSWGHNSCPRSWEDFQGIQDLRHSVAQIVQISLEEVSEAAHKLMGFLKPSGPVRSCVRYPHPAHFSLVGAAANDGKATEITAKRRSLNP